MIPRLGDGNREIDQSGVQSRSLENDSPSRERKRIVRAPDNRSLIESLENDSPSRGRKPKCIGRVIYMDFSPRV